jgi:hypothetical protein
MKTAEPLGNDQAQEAVIQGEGPLIEPDEGQRSFLKPLLCQPPHQFFIEMSMVSQLLYYNA